MNAGSADRVANIFFIFYAADKAAPMHDPTKLRLAIFLLELNLKEKGLSGPHFTFIQSRKGPFSKELWDTLGELQTRGFVEGKDLSVTKRGQFLGNLILPELRAIPENGAVFAIVESTLKKCQSETGDSLREIIGNMALRPEGEFEAVKVEDFPPDKVLMVPVPGSLKVPQDLATLFFQEFELSGEDVAKAEKDWPEIETRALDSLRRAMNGGQPV